MSARPDPWIDVALGEAEAPQFAGQDARLLEVYERTAARTHLALVLRAPLAPPRDLRQRLVEQGLRCMERRRSLEGDA